MKSDKLVFDKKPNTVNIVCIGSWNVKIFSPIWVANNVFSIDLEQLEGLFNQEEVEIGYKNTLNNIFIFPRSSSLEIRIEECNTEVLPEAVKILNRVLKELPHTPIKGIGFNFNYSFEGKEKELPFIADICKKIESFQFDSFIPEKVNLKKQFKDHVLNLTFENVNNKMVINFNFHYSNSFSFEENIFEDHLNLIQKCCNYE